MKIAEEKDQRKSSEEESGNELALAMEEGGGVQWRERSACNPLLVVEIAQSSSQGIKNGPDKNCAV